MLKKVLLFTAAVILLTGVVNLFAQEESDRSERARPRRERLMGEGFDKWLNEITKANEEKDSEKVGQLLEEMKQNRQRMRERMESRGEGREGFGGRGMGREGRRRVPEGEGMQPVQEERPIVSSEAEAKIISVLEDMNQNQRRGMMNVSPENGRLLRLLTETAGTKHVVEIGTSNGYSGIWFCLGLRATGGRLTTHEINAERASLARENFKRAGVEQIVTLIEGDAHKEITNLKGPIDIVFIDADKAGYMDYLNKVLPLVRPSGLILAHNTTNSGPDMQDYLKAITTRANLETIFLHKEDRGISVTLKKGEGK
jgi:caffeoyl-CoA O-methyltransferase